MNTFLQITSFKGECLIMLHACDEYSMKAGINKTKKLLRNSFCSKFFPSILPIFNGILTKVSLMLTVHEGQRSDCALTAQRSDCALTAQRSDCALGADESLPGW